MTKERAWGTKDEINFVLGLGKKSEDRHGETVHGSEAKSVLTMSRLDLLLAYRAAYLKREPQVGVDATRVILALNQEIRHEDAIDSILTGPTKSRIIYRDEKSTTCSSNLNAKP